MQKLWASKQAGFTVVELIIVIIVISILAAITIVAYIGTQDRAAESAADSAIAQIAKKLEGYKIAKDVYPEQLSDLNIEQQNDVIYDYAAAMGEFCLSATVRDTSRSILSTTEDPFDGNCSLALIKWDYTGGGLAYDAEQNLLQASDSQAGAASSPMVANNGAPSAKISAEVYATEPSINNSPLASNHYSSKYYAADKSTLVENTNGYKSNGHAACDIPLNKWTVCSWTVATGPNVEWVQFVVRSTPGSYTSDNKYRNISITVND